MQAADHLEPQQATDPDFATKGLVDSGYSSQETFAMPPGAHDQDTSTQTLGYSGSPAKSHLSEVAKSCGISKSDSTTSARTVKSISVIGAYPLGTLKVHKVDETPEPSDAERDPMAESSSVVAASPPAVPPKCLDTGDCFIIIGLPDKFTVGLDTIALTTSNGKDFRGFRHIPPGPHFLWMSEPGAISRCGYWFVTGQRGEVRVKQWDHYSEVLGDAASHFDELEQRKNIEETYPLMPHNFQGDVASTITPPPPPPKDDQPRRGSIPDPDPDFTADNLSIWHQLTSAINPAFLSRVTGKKTVSEWLVDTTDGARGDIPHDPTKLIKSIVGSQLDFLFQQDIIDLQLLNITAGDHSADDTTPRILALLNNSSKRSSTSSQSPTPPTTETDILAELQFTFLTGLHLGNYTCIEQWWHLLLKILLRAHALVLSHPSLTRSVLQTLHAQMVYNDRYIDHAARAESPSRSTDPYYTSSRVPKDDVNSILETIPHNKAKLREALTVYKRRLNQALLQEGRGISPDQGAVGRAFADLEAWFWRFGWDLRSDYREDDTAPAEQKTTVVSGGGRRRRMVMSDGDSEEDEDDAPAVVELDEDGREVGLVSFHH
ncbi:AAR2 protein-domain-containing protein [Coniochaeta sp. 2T2.1]|nr:AAR2 protein-domain-containing protein [Coniochaeta sp. 2T2.1]